MNLIAKLLLSFTKSASLSQATSSKCPSQRFYHVNSQSSYRSNITRGLACDAQLAVTHIRRQKCPGNVRRNIGGASCPGSVRGEL